MKVNAICDIEFKSHDNKHAFDSSEAIAEKVTVEEGCNTIRKVFDEIEEVLGEKEALRNKLCKITNTHINDNVEVVSVGNKADYSWACIVVKDDYFIIRIEYSIKRTGLYTAMDLEHIDIVLDNGAIIPTRAHDEDAGLDLYAPCFCIVPPHGSSVVDTGVHFDIPKGYVGKLESKSGLMRNKGITCEGTIDAGYHGTIQAVLFNHTDKPVTFDRGSKITQMVIYPIANPRVNVISSFINDTDRGDNGFGSTGK